MRVLFSSTAGAGHFHPLVPFARAVAGAGHDVLVAAPAGFGDAVEKAGFEFWPFDPPLEEELGAVWARLPTLSFDGANAVVIGDIFARLNSTASLPRLQEACATWGPDVVVRDPSEFGSAVAAEQARVPCVRVAIGLASVEEMAIGHAAPQVDVIRRSAGLSPDPDGYALRESPILSMFPATFEDPAHPGPSTTNRFADPAWDERGSADQPAWMPPGDGPLVYVTFGSVAGGLGFTTAAYQAAVAALAALNLPALLTVGQGFDLDALGPVPDTIRVERWVPQNEVLARANVMVSHGGSGATLGALAAGLPHVVVPLFADQPYNAERVQETGAGLVVAPPDGQAVANAIKHVLDDASFRATAGAMAAEMRNAHQPIDGAVTILVELAGERGRRSAALEG